jgi:hypothetical protein
VLPTLLLIQGEVQFDLRACWDCALSQRQVLAQVVFLGAVCTLGLYLGGKGGNVAPAIGGALLIFALLVPVMYSASVPNWGVIKSESPQTFYDRSTVRTFFIAIALIEGTAVVRWYRTAEGGPRRCSRPLRSAAAERQNR